VPKDDPFPFRPDDAAWDDSGPPEPEPRTLDPLTPLDRLIRKWALVAVVWLAVAAIAGLRGAHLSAGLIACLVFFVLGAARLR
jgi:hypothetical protein